MVEQQISQKDAVVLSVKKVLGSSYSPSSPVKLSREQMMIVRDDIVSKIMSGGVSYGKPLNKNEVDKYVVSLIANHLKKAKELNGNVVYKTSKQVSSKTFKGDDKIKALSLLLSKTSSEDEKNAISKEIESRKEEMLILDNINTKKVNNSEIYDIDVTIR